MKFIKVKTDEDIYLKNGSFRGSYSFYSILSLFYSYWGAGHLQYLEDKYGRDEAKEA